ncbi:MAG: adenylate/guanylate cyclase domain-containing protein, partial [Rhizobiales bacterium]|nr:adenylate/guanylate cyclase domain-containing protein [Hyphomicrobiales bacterium]
LMLERDKTGKLIFEAEANQNAPELKRFLDRIRAGRETTWNQPFRVADATLVTVVAPLYRGSEFLGVAGAAISLQELSALVSALGTSTGPVGFILYGNDHVLAHRNLPLLPTSGLGEHNPMHKIAALGDPVIDRFVTRPQGYSPPDKSFTVHDFEIGDLGYVVLSRRFAEFGPVPWTLGLYSPRSNWDAQLSRLGRSIIGGLILLVLAIVAAIVLARRIAAPVRSTAEAAVKIGALDLDQIEPLPPSRITELNNQATAFNQMLDGLKWFQTYVPRQLVRRLVRQREKATVVSREQDLTVMFTDIVGFTAMSETKSPTEIAEMLNRHFEVLYQCIEAEGGTLDKYIGDAAMAFWGAPEEQPDHAMRACRAALAARKAFAEVEPDQRIKIAIHTGPLIVGNIGAVGRMNYTVIGDTVNTCSRIEKLAGDLDAGEATIILVSDATAAELDDGFEVEAAGEFQLKGREKPVTVYRLCGE